MEGALPKKSVFSRDLSVFQKNIFEIGGLHPKLARYQLRYTSIELWGFKYVGHSGGVSARPFGLNAPSHSRRVSLDALASAAPCFGLIASQNCH